MTVERAILVRIAMNSPLVEVLLRDIEGARARSVKSLPGERDDIIRYESLCAKLEFLAFQALDEGAPWLEMPPGDRSNGFYASGRLDGLEPHVATTVADWIADGFIGVELRLPFCAGKAVVDSPVSQPHVPAEVWKAPSGAEGTRAVTLRFRCQVEDVLKGSPGSAIRPSGVASRILTETLRQFSSPQRGRLDAPVVYRDGSQGRPFPLRSLTMRTDLAGLTGSIIRVSLLSIRHPEMDAEVDGA
jgi:hypothetical protein